MTFISLLLVFVLFIWLYKACCPSYRLRKYGNRIPGPSPALPIFGNTWIFFKKKSFLQTIIKQSDLYGSVIRIWLGKHLLLVLSDPKDIEVFLVSNKYLDKSDSYRLLDTWLGNKGLITSDADVWRTHRKCLTTSFHFKILETSVGMIQRNANILCDKLMNRVNAKEFDILQYTEKCSLDIISETAMGIRFETQKSDNTVYLDAIKDLQKSTVERFFSVWQLSEFIFKNSSSGRRYYKALPIVKRVVAEVIQERKKLLAENKENHITNDISKKQIKPFLDSMLLESNFTDEEIENEVQTFLFAGHDTTTTTIAFCLYALSRHPDVQEKILEEYESIAKDSDGDLTYQQYYNMNYLNNVIKETLRMYTTVPIISRKVSEDIRLPSGYTLPAGSLANLFLQHMHNNEKYFPNPDQFLPERFENPDGCRNPFAYVPFSAGPRNCIGQKFAMLEMKVIITALVQKYKFLPSETVKSLSLETGIVLRSMEKIPVRVVLRQAEVHYNLRNLSM